MTTLSDVFPTRLMGKVRHRRDDFYTTSQCEWAGRYLLCYPHAYFFLGGLQENLLLGWWWSNQGI